MNVIIEKIVEASDEMFPILTFFVSLSTLIMVSVMVKRQGEILRNTRVNLNW